MHMKRNRDDDRAPSSRPAEALLFRRKSAAAAELPALRQPLVRRRAVTLQAHRPATLTDTQADDLQKVMLYANVHTDANKGGEIRGQVVKA
jgi:hypothetical protein